MRFRWLVLISQGLAILLITLVLTEAAFRAFHAIRPSFIFSSSSYNQFRPPPHTRDYDFKLNSLGFKDIEPLSSKRGFRVVAIGDSFAYGVVPYAFNYLTLLDDLLDTETQTVELVNLGIPRLDVLDYRDLLLAEGLEMNPDLVLVGFFIGNDFRIRPRKPSHRQSFVAEFLRYVTMIWPKQKVGFHPREYHDDRPTFLAEVFLELRKGPAQQFMPQNKVIEWNLPKIVAILEEMQRACTERGSRMLVTLLPDELQVDRDLQKSVIRQMNVSEDVDWRRPSVELKQALQQAQIPVLDLLPAFEKAGESQKLYKPRDTHWNIAGNRLAAETIQAYWKFSSSPTPLSSENSLPR